MARLALGRSSVSSPTTTALLPRVLPKNLLLLASTDSVDVPIHLYCLYSHLNPDFSSHWAGRDEVLACTCRFVAPSQSVLSASSKLLALEGATCTGPRTN